MGFADTILNKMNITISDSSIGYRQYEFAYYSSLLFNGKWKTGLGILTSMNANGKILMFGNLDTQMYLDDLGIFECFLQFGLFSLFLYGVLLIYMIYVVIKCNRVKEYKYSLYLLGEFFLYCNCFYTVEFVWNSENIYGANRLGIHLCCSQ